MLISELGHSYTNYSVAVDVKYVKLITKPVFNGFQNPRNCLDYSKHSLKMGFT